MKDLRSAIDVGKLPSKCLIDTGVLIRALGEIKDDRAPMCVSFVKQMLRHNRTMLIAAPSIAEVIRKNSSAKVPSTERMRVVAFDQDAAELLGRDMPQQVLYEMAKESGISHGYIRYDAMIVACAARWSANCIVHLDRRHFPKLAGLVNVPVSTPHDYGYSLFLTMPNSVSSDEH